MGKLLSDQLQILNNQATKNASTLQLRRQQKQQKRKIEIGLVLLLFSVILYFFGIILFFARSFLLLSNLFFLAGLYFFVGFTGSLKFFTKKGKIKGSFVYFGGMLLIVLNFGFFGALAQIGGFILIFRSFLPDLYDYICKAPFVGKYLKSYWIQNSLQKLAGTSNRI